MLLRASPCQRKPREASHIPQFSCGASTPTMAPNAKPMTSQSSTDSIQSVSVASVQLNSERNVTYGVNYSKSLSSISEFVTSSRKSDWNATVESTVDSTVRVLGESRKTAQSSSRSNDSDHHHTTTCNSALNRITSVGNTSDPLSPARNDGKTIDAKKVNFAGPTTRTGTPQSVRKSRRQPKPKAFLLSSPTDRSATTNQTQLKSRVRYDINLVPYVKKSPTFVQYWRSMTQNNKNGQMWTRAGKTGDTDTANSSKKRDLPPRMRNSQETVCQIKHDLLLPEVQIELRPFDGDETVVWIPESRQQWEDCLSELTAVCKSAAFRKYQRASAITAAKEKNRNGSSNDDIPMRPFCAPLASDYIRDRIDIDDPLIGYQIRHKIGGWLQGFIMFTNFTTWSHYFKWDSMHHASGVQQVAASTANKCMVDADGSLASQLEHQQRSGDPLGGGIVFESIAEISLVGGLGCGEYLLRMALDDISRRQQYHYVVLQATDTSRTFYEKFGFVRVGAISRYGPRTKGRKAFNDQELSDIVGYRHWTYAHESEQSLGKHGGPSYMMALRLGRLTGKEEDESATFLATMKKFSVVDKPKVKQLGAAPTPMMKRNLMISPLSSSRNLASIPELPNLHQHPTPAVAKKGVDHRKRRRSSASEASTVTTAISSSPSSIETAISSTTTKPIAGKKRRSLAVKSKTRTANTYQFMESRDKLLTPPPPGQSLTYAQKQYQSVWLAVPAKKEIVTRRPPRERGPEIEKVVSSSLKRSQETKMAGNKRKNKGSISTKAIAAFAPGSNTNSNRRTGPPREMKKSLVLKASTRKQKAPTIPKRISEEHHFVNKIVQRKDSRIVETSNRFFYVLHFNIKHMVLKLLPMVCDDDVAASVEEATRPRWRAIVVGNQCVIQPAAMYQIVQSHMLVKTPIVANERWDILD